MTVKWGNKKVITHRYFMSANPPWAIKQGYDVTKTSDQAI